MIPSRRTERVGRGVIHCLARCSVASCGWEEENYERAERLATQHVRKTGHSVMVDQGIVYEVRLKEADRE